MTIGPTPATSSPRRRAVPLRLQGSRLRAALSFWSRSLLLRVAVLTLFFSTLAMFGVGLVLQQQITKGLLVTRQNVALAEVEKAAQTVQSDLQGADADPSSLARALGLTLQKLGNPALVNESNATASNSGAFDPVIIPADSSLTVGPLAADVPADLKASVLEGNVAYQYTTVRNVPALVVGSPASTSTDTFSVFLIFSLAADQATAAVVRNTLLLGGAGLALALALIAVLVALQVVRPVRRAAAVAQRLAAGDLAERMPVKGPIELTALARSFNGMADAIRAQIRQLEEFGSLQRRFTSDVSHELRTPVTTVRMAADLLYDSREDLPAHLGRSTELLVAELDRFETLLADLLEISRYDAGMAELSAEKVDIRGVIASCIAASEPIAANAGVKIRRTLPPKPVVAEIDSRRVERILRNLLNNAIDHADGSTVDVELVSDSDVLAITVTDHGVGLKPGEAGLVFNRFWRADPSRQRQTGGTGLGLAISLEDARLHGGWLQASGGPGQGARFRLTLPLVAGALVESSPLPLRIGDEGDDAGPDASDPMDNRDWNHHGLAGALPAGGTINWPGVLDAKDEGAR
ncbi:two-component system, OmpR family, sensor histidine kinase MtrB [Nakamurella panacisegetis]|uniref:Sensor histidine kinase MtrB n=1 Tax=Nakamurella panacisegetis TaxID=1090615 RepID=A0A1H0I7T9_9ACTN|nr:MtrAB system histidine kinase MtrB [Nakamurella panacisegetis]SDO27171.1 two-component system, OmpR family, sensor histidine kinase MtrB [Nakamurella panacisegetis]